MENQKSHLKSIAWQPSASINNLRKRSNLLKTIRDFFLTKGIMEVDTPLLCRASVTDPYIESIPALFHPHTSKEKEYYYLQTSPEYAMKRLLAAGSGDIFQISKAFRQGETGRFHNPEFTMIEWYRLGFDHHDLMNEVDELLQLVLNTLPAERKSYHDMFMQHLQLNPHFASLEELKSVANDKNISISGDIHDRDIWLQLLMSEYIEPQIGQEKPCFIYDFPASQAALSRVQPGNPPLSSRFEVYYLGIELANGFHELQDVNEQRNRFEKNILERNQLGLNEMAIDEFFLSALTHGLPDCAGVALGIDRLVMLAIEKKHIADALSFDFARV